MEMKIKIFIMNLFWGLGLVLVISPVVLYWFIHGSYERYIWIINGPYPFSSLGSGSFQILVYAGLFTAGICLVFIALVFKNKTRKTAGKTKL